MKPNKDISEHTMNGDPVETDSLTDTDMAYHRFSVWEAYQQLLHEPSVIDECCKRFKNTFEKPIRYNFCDVTKE